MKQGRGRMDHRENKGTENKGNGRKDGPKRRRKRGDGRAATEDKRRKERRRREGGQEREGETEGRGETEGNGGMHKFNSRLEEVPGGLDLVINPAGFFT